MDKIKKILARVQKITFVAPKHTMNISNKFFSILILIMAVGIMIQAGSIVYLTYENFLSYNFKDALNNAVFIVVLVKAFQLLLFYYQSQYVSIKQVLELVIVALLVNITFSFDLREIWTNVTLNILTLGCVVIYLIFYDKLADIDKK